MAVSLVALSFHSSLSVSSSESISISLRVECPPGLMGDSWCHYYRINTLTEFISAPAFPPMITWITLYTDNMDNTVHDNMDNTVHGDEICMNLGV